MLAPVLPHDLHKRVREFTAPFQRSCAPADHLSNPNPLLPTLLPPSPPPFPTRSGAGGPMGPVISTLAGGSGPGAEGAGGDAHGEGTLHGAASRGDVAGVTRCLRQGTDKDQIL